MDLIQSGMLNRSSLLAAKFSGMMKPGKCKGKPHAQR